MAPTAQTPVSKQLAERRGRRNELEKNAASKAARVRQRVLAVFLPITAVLYPQYRGAEPQGHRSGDHDYGRRVLRSCPSPRPTRPSCTCRVRCRCWRSAAWRCRTRRSPGWSPDAAGSSPRSPRCWAAWARSPGPSLNVLGGISLAAAASAHMTHIAAAQLPGHEPSSSGSVPGTPGTSTSPANTPRRSLMGFALWRSRRRAPLAGRLVHFRGPGTRRGAARHRPQGRSLYMLPFAVAMILLAVKIWRVRPPGPLRTCTTSTPRLRSRRTPQPPRCSPPRGADGPSSPVPRPIAQQLQRKGDRHGHHRTNPGNERGARNPHGLDKEDRARRGHLLPAHLRLDPHARPLRPREGPTGLDPRLRRPHWRARGRPPRGDRRSGLHRHRRHAVPGSQAAERRRRAWLRRRSRP